MWFVDCWQKVTFLLLLNLFIFKSWSFPNPHPLSSAADLSYICSWYDLIKTSPTGALSSLSDSTWASKKAWWFKCISNQKMLSFPLNLPVIPLVPPLFLLLGKKIVSTLTLGWLLMVKAALVSLGDTEDFNSVNLFSTVKSLQY